ncbi:MAG: hypothetical protein Q4G36_02175 [Paracoccus sp. (in: a-proteobacteria)]|nr:hypothetical protein [Paracoccus sp. (in: a-proteobacteria)]
MSGWERRIKRGDGLDPAGRGGSGWRGAGHPTMMARQVDQITVKAARPTGQQPVTVQR